MDARPRIVDGVLRVDDQPRYFLNADYPYFRDDPANWRDRLVAQREAGLDIVTCYVPWRHHAPIDPLRGGGAYDFTGRTQENRDIVGFLRLVQEEGLLALLKPGPFVHAELPFGGLPDYVCSDCHPGSGIEPERDAAGEPLRWSLRGMRPGDVHVLPAPFGEAYLAYVRDYFRAFAREVAAPRMWPRGPILGFQILNEGIYSDSSRAMPTSFGHAPSTLQRYRSFLAERCGTLERVNAAHGTRHAAWGDVAPPASAQPLGAVEELTAYLDWSAFQGRMYADVAALYQGYLLEAGVPEDAPIVFNFNPNGSTYRSDPGSNDGWYTRLNLEGHKTFAFGLTNWIGVVAGDAKAFRQYVMATTAFRGPAMEMNWGFAREYFAPYEYVSPSVYEAMVALACGATGLTAYTFAGTRAFRRDANLDGPWSPERTNARRDASSQDYPGDAPVLSTGEKTGKYWSLVQLAQYLGDEGPRFVEKGLRPRVAWGVYAPYAWAGQWLPRGDVDDPTWRPPLHRVPRAAYHGLDAFTEMCLARGIAPHQVDLTRDEGGLASAPMVAVSVYEYMDARTQHRLASYVRDGGRLLLTGMVPTRDERMRPLRGALADLLPHEETDTLELRGPTALWLDGEEVGLVSDAAHVVRPPSDADQLVRLGGRVVGYRRVVGEGRVAYLGANPWCATLSGDDALVSARDQALAWRLLGSLGSPQGLSMQAASEDAVAFWHGDDHLFLVARERSGWLAAGDLRVRSPSLAAHAVALERGAFRACYLKGITDTRAERVAPRLEGPGWVVEADDPCDLCVTRTSEGLRITVAHLEGGSTRVRLPGLHDAVRVTTLERAGASQKSLRYKTA